MKQIKITFLLFVLMSMMSVKAFAYDAKVDGIYYNFGGGKATVTYLSYGGNSNAYSGDVIIPETVTYNGKTYSVTSIGSSAFSGCTGLTSINIPNSVTTIGNDAFHYCTGLTSINIPNSVTTIGDYAFNSEKRNYISVTIGSGVQSIGAYVFSSSFKPQKVIWLAKTPPTGYYNAAGNINYVPNNSYTSLKDKTVYPYLSSMFEVDGVKYVPVSPSERTCDAIDCLYNETAENIYIGNTVSYQGVQMTVNQIRPYTCYENKYIKTLKVYWKGDFGEYAFSDCRGMKTLEIGTNVTSIGNHTFSGCTGLTSINIPNSVTTIGNNAFSGCTGLTSINIPNSVTTIGNNAFSGCRGLTSINIPNSVTTIGSWAFSGCGKLTSINIPNSVTTIGNNAFRSCRGLTSINIPNSVTTIGNDAFHYCEGLTSINIPSSVTSIGEEAFNYCTGLKSVLMEDGTTTLAVGSSIFLDCPLETVYIGRNISYNTSNGSPFYGNKTLKNVCIGNDVTTIGNRAFSGCSSLEQLTFGSGMKTIGQEAFSDCTAMTKLISKATVPPTCDTQALDDINKWNCTLYVPDGSIAAYQAADQWKEFFFIDLGVKNPTTAGSEEATEYKDVYDLHGRKLSQPKRGVNIMKMSDGTTKKVVVK